MFSSTLLQRSPVYGAAHFLVASLPAVRRLSTDAASAVEAAILQCDNRLVIPATLRSGKHVDRNAVLHTLNYAIPELENEAPEAAAAVRLAVNLLTEAESAPFR
ncbi:hypothetical protein [Jiella sp. M17.18]|uniref:hypothetical protein n=1 Tax=Jiella sp. M17.18 TaxID=3234247 RepID=UPI0034DFF821